MLSFSSTSHAKIKIENRQIPLPHPVLAVSRFFKFIPGSSRFCTFQGAPDSAYLVQFFSSTIHIRGQNYK